MTARRPTRAAGGRVRDDSSASIPAATARLRAPGLGVATQFAIGTAGAVAASLIVFGFVLYRIVAGILSDEIDEAGIQAVRALAVVDAKCWMPFHETELEGFEKEAESGALRVELSQEKKDRFERRSAQNRQRLRKLVEATGTKLLDAVVVDPGMRSVLSGAGPIKLELSGSQRQVGEVTIQEGTYSQGDRRRSARTYAADIRDEAGIVSAKAIVALSEEKIDQSLTRVITALALLTAVFIGVGILVSAVLGRRITRPIQRLAVDMETVARGDLEHRTHAQSSDEIGLLARTFDRMTTNLQQLQGVEREKAAQEHQIEVAREVQAALLPEKLPAIAGFECAAASRPAAKVVGDSYDVTDMAGGAKLLVLVSASGSGVPGAMVVGMARSLLKALASHETSPSELLRKANRLLAPDLRRGMYVSALLVRVEPDSGRLVVANAGHHPLLLCRSGGARAEPFHGDGIALGFDKGPIFDRTIKDRELELAPGERVLLCSRQIFAIKDAEGREIGEEAVYELFQNESPRASGDFVPFTLAALESYREGTEATEDVVFLTLKRVERPK